MIGLSDGQTVSGTITFGPNLERHRRIRKAGYYIRKVGYDTSDQQFGKVYKAPFYWGGRTGDGAQKFDTRTLANGTYRLSGYITTETGDDLEFEALTFTVTNLNLVGE